MPPELLQLLAGRLFSVASLLAVTEVISEADIRCRDRQNVLTALSRAEWKIYGPDGAAALLGVKASTLTSWIQKMGIKKPGEQSGT